MPSKFEIVQGVIASPELYQARELWKARELLKTSTINENHYFWYDDLLSETVSPDQTPPNSPRSVLDAPF